MTEQGSLSFVSLCHESDSSTALSEEENKARCHCTLSFGFSVHRAVFMIVSLSLQPTHAVYPAAPAFCSYQYSAAHAAAGHGDSHYATVSPGYRNAEATAPHHGPGRLEEEGGSPWAAFRHLSFTFGWIRLNLGKEYRVRNFTFFTVSAM